MHGAISIAESGPRHGHLQLLGGERCIVGRDLLGQSQVGVEAAFARDAGELRVRRRRQHRHWRQRHRCGRRSRACGRCRAGKGRYLTERMLEEK